jgi:hypothetical protein
MSRANRRREWRRDWPAGVTLKQPRRYRRLAWLRAWAAFTVDPRPAWKEEETA